eukprot:TRINITY_DN484_c0_g3_i2.p1 TRINITY_DN484_c0_g3~~TRINITY_DN484_c0_g3_i2.p1  ORF type:complete len:118 (-),score=55.01 TRINITY_DN484_c0_g3_i2:125-478(-)
MPFQNIRSSIKFAQNIQRGCKQNLNKLNNLNKKTSSSSQNLNSLKTKLKNQSSISSIIGGSLMLNGKGGKVPPSNPLSTKIDNTGIPLLSSSSGQRPGGISSLAALLLLLDEDDDGL